MTETITCNYTSGRIHRMRRLPPGPSHGSRVLGEYVSRALPHYHTSYALIVPLQSYDPHTWDDLCVALRQQMSRRFAPLMEHLKICAACRSIIEVVGKQHNPRWVLLHRANRADRAGPNSCCRSAGTSWHARARS